MGMFSVEFLNIYTSLLITPPLPPPLLALRLAAFPREFNEYPRYDYMTEEDRLPKLLH